MELLALDKLFKENREKLELENLSVDEALKRRISSAQILRPSFALTGYYDYLKTGKILLFDDVDFVFLQKLDLVKQQQFFAALIKFHISAIILSKTDFVVPDYFIEQCKTKRILLLKSSQHGTKIIHILSDYLDFHFAPKVNIHGTLVDVFGIGLLFMGKSGIGKSEIALDLIERGHRLVADDLVICTKKNKFLLMGRGREFSEHFLEIRGIGLVDVKRLYGIRSARIQKRIEVVVELVEWDQNVVYDRLGLNYDYKEINGVNIPRVCLPLTPGKNMTVLSETIALNHLTRVYGLNPAQEFNDRLIKSMEKKAKERKEYDEFLEDDVE